jgi:signal transduction histidine kinase
MKNLTHSLPAKVAAVFLLALLAAVAFTSALGIAYAYSEGLYGYSYTSFYDTEFCRDETLSLARNLVRYYEQGLLTESSWFDAEWNNCRFILYKEGAENEPLYMTEQPEKAGYELTGTVNGYVVTCTVQDPISIRDNYYASYRLFNLINPLRYALIVLLISSLLLGTADFVFLCCAAGHRRGSERVLLNHQDKIPLDLYWASAALLIFLLLNVTFSVGYDYSSYEAPRLVMGFLLLLMAGLILLSALLTFATRIKVGRWWENTILYRLLRLGRRSLKTAGRGMLQAFRAVPLIPRAILTVGAVLLLEVLLTGGLVSWGGAFLGLLWFSFNALLFLLLCYGALQMKRLETAGERLASGALEFKLDTSKMYWDFKKHGDHLNAIADGLSAAVEQRMKSERLKTELITNVSHDIKTPLTSIVNYVDLLQKEHTREQEAVYLEVLARQSRRLKKLTEDLVEASKASTGSISVTLTNTDLGELLRQSAGEYAERLELAKLEIVLTLPEEPVSALADGRLLWRVMDNLLGNVCKYALPGTRVYIDVRKERNDACICLKNISREKLNISADELMERFVRGDSARNTEGSGLGLNIAKSLVELQKGSFRLAVDGDLFKVEIRLMT